MLHRNKSEIQVIQEEEYHLTFYKILSIIKLVLF